ncbi:cytochrome d ubiquinol oxidase subunit II [Simiduia curdlanivorans]|uniref:Cytochrome d ubiquinol oxidase subunit II n=1 Tax=Simiduia curdlanivorans TaxID=1492769 RepID=A0ABV8V923_9GAMM|nr:cytochrome d ubiquinol oxidase subunit II [Simiduia curdlanivorans]MDN3639056.1 cytochrome d ubiquinol oxidase subunit II [Simiduia curdlanivorans]
MNLSADTLAYIFLGLLGLTVLIYAVLDGYDLGVGILLPMENLEQRNQMIASIGPFWDANETWLVLAVGILLIAFPKAHSLVLFELYLPAVMLLIGLILRGVAFDLRAKAITNHQRAWDWAFKLGSLTAALAQGYMLGRYVTGFEPGWAALGFAALSAVCVAAAYVYIGSAWLIMKTEDALQVRALGWIRLAGALTLLGLLFVSLINLTSNREVVARWFSFPGWCLLLAIPALGWLCLYWIERSVKQLYDGDDSKARRPFFGVVTLFLLSFLALGFSYFPYVVPGQLLATEAASAKASLEFILVGVVIVLPVIIGYTIFSYRVFWGKSTDLHYY